jgi:hypothetical protein
MLFVGDIHITQRWSNRIVDQLRVQIQQSGEEHIVFVGDYVYHFSYDRKALLQLFGLFVELMQEGKSLHILAGNHDWLSGHFVYQEAQLLVDASNRQKQQQVKTATGTIDFITEPCRKQIEGEWVWFFPYNQNLRASDEQLAACGDYQPLIESKHKGEKVSGHINTIFADFVQQCTGSNPLIVHHYYIANTPFPGQRARFSYKNIALDAKWLDDASLRLVSGHLHKPFVHQNYLCVGSVWATSPLEYNQAKCLVSYGKGKASLTPMSVNMYLRLETQDDRIEQQHVDAMIQSSRAELDETMMSSNVWQIEKATPTYAIDYGAISLQLLVSEKNYSGMDDYVDHDLQWSVRDIQLQTSRVSLDDLLTDLDISHDKLQTQYSQWRSVLEAYVRKKYPSDFEAYFDLLREVKLL